MTTPYDPRAGELLAWEAETGRALPMPAAEIIALEDGGWIVDLDTGAIYDGVTLELTPYGEAVGVLMTLEGVADDAI